MLSPRSQVPLKAAPVPVHKTPYPPVRLKARTTVACSAVYTLALIGGSCAPDVGAACTSAAANTASTAVVRIVFCVIDSLIRYRFRLRLLQ